MQIVLTGELNKLENLWLYCLTDELRGQKEAEELAIEYKKHKKEKLYESVMDVVVRANNEKFREAKNMCKALEELMEDELNKKKLEGFQEGRQELLIAKVKAKLEKGKSIEVIADELDESVVDIKRICGKIVYYKEGN